MKVLFGVFIGIISVVLVLVLIAGYLGFVPGVSKIFGSDKPVDLGATWSQADYLSANAKSGIKFTDLTPGLPAEQSIVISGPARPVSADFTQAEFNALLNVRTWEYYPLKDCQMRINSDNTMEFSCLVLTDRFEGYARTVGISEDTQATILNQIKMAGILQKEIPYYVRAKASVVNGQIDFTTYQVKVGRLSISGSMIDKYKPDLISMAQNRISHVAGFSCNNFSIANGKVHFDGTLPTSVQRSPAPK